MAKEIERKYLICRVKDKYLTQPAAERWDIVQTYLLTEPGVTERVRKLRTAGEEHYFHTVKRRISTLTAEEAEEEITPAAYGQYLLRADPALKAIGKTRWRIPCAGHTLEIDRYPFWDRADILEVELSREDEAVSFPAFITILREVTADVRFKNVSLAREIPAIDGYFNV